MSPSTLQRNLESALSTAAERDRVREQVQAALNSGMSRDDILLVLEETRAGYREHGHEREEEIIMDVMDLFAGWAHPSVRL
jgi:hypothetical protein